MASQTRCAARNSRDRRHCPEPESATFRPRSRTLLWRRCGSSHPRRQPSGVIPPAAAGPGSPPSKCGGGQGRRAGRDPTSPRKFRSLARWPEFLSHMAYTVRYNISCPRDSRFVFAFLDFFLDFPFSRVLRFLMSFYYLSTPSISITPIRVRCVQSSSKQTDAPGSDRVSTLRTYPIRLRTAMLTISDS